METKQREVITVQTTVNAPLETAWKSFSEPEHITQWSFAGDDWHTPKADNDLRVGGKFSTRMEAKDGSMGFDFAGVYDEVKEHDVIAYTIGDGRKVTINFKEDGGKTEVVEKFEAEDMYSIDQQKMGWQMILDNYKKHTETL